MTNQTLTFEMWKTSLRYDCEWHQKQAAFEALDDYVLEMLWQRGVEPTVQAIVEDGDGRP